ncbi:protein FAM98B [Pseudoliparis swirei]|uniref:protein FAM98B n=1 Tax=Pseudoliparis swirei TaxID=2059687 RepID=UPI0024BE289F|nr:protein FAM98B [Pseudoliparis swirei]
MEGDAAMEGDVLDALQQLGYGGPLREEEALLGAAAGGLSSPEYVELCRWLASRLQLLCGLEESITSGPVLECDPDPVAPRRHHAGPTEHPPSGTNAPVPPAEVQRLQVELSALLKELHWPCEEVGSGILKGGARTTRDHLKVVLFLSSELQAAQIVSGGGGGARQHDQGPVHRELRAICETLNLPEPSGRDAAGLFSHVQHQVEEVLKGLPNGFLGNPALRRPLGSDQWEKLNVVNAALTAEYECRRKMMIKRLDVTVMSFSWADRAKVQVDRVARAYQPRRRSLRPRAAVDMAALLAARGDVCNVVKTSSGSSRERTSCAVNKILMGRVPDRGGRPSEMEAPRPEMPPWQARQDGGGSWRGGGQNRGGHGGGGVEEGTEPWWTWEGGSWGGGQNRGGHGGGGGGGSWGGGGHGGRRGRY